jgi:hypothetical protein
MRGCFALISVVALLCLLSVPADAGIISFTVSEFKGTVVPVVPIVEEFLSRIEIQVAPPPIVVDLIFNEEIVAFLVGPPIDVYNFYHQTIEIPQPPGFFQLIDIFWFIAADVGAGIGPLPDGAALQSAALIGPVTGTLYPATITPISDLSALPTSSANDISINWDLSALSDTTGNFFLAQASIPVSELVPEPSSIVLFATGALAVAAYSRRRRYTARKPGNT